MDCRCHGVPQLWIKDVRYTAGGFWRCRIKHRAVCAAGHQRRSEDPVWRHMREIKSTRGKRAATRERRRVAVNPKMAALLAVTRRS